MSSHYYFVFNFLREVARSNLYQLVLDRKPLISVTVNIHRSNSTVTVQTSGNSKQVFKNKRFPPLTFLWLMFHFRQLFLNVILNTSRHCWNKKRQKWAMHSKAMYVLNLGAKHRTGLKNCGVMYFQQRPLSQSLGLFVIATAWSKEWNNWISIHFKRKFS